MPNDAYTFRCDHCGKKQTRRIGTGPRSGFGVRCRYCHEPNMGPAMQRAYKKTLLQPGDQAGGKSSKVPPKTRQTTARTTVVKTAAPKTRKLPPTVAQTTAPKATPARAVKTRKVPPTVAQSTAPRPAGTRTGLLEALRKGVYGG